MLGVGMSLFMLLLGLGCAVWSWFLWNSGMSEVWLREKMSHFECGLELKDSARLPFSLRFFFLLLLFLLFDVELSFIIFWVFNFGNDGFMKAEVLSFFILIVIFGLFEEWRRGCLSWSF